MPLPLVPLALLGGSALAGGLASKFGKKGRYEKVPLYNEQQQGALNQLLQQGQQNTNFQGIEDRARQQFQTRTVPSIAERFASAGENRASSGLLGSLGGAGADLESQLGGLRSQYGMQQLQQGLRPQNENVYRPAQPGFFGGALSGLGGGLGALGMQGLGQHYGLFGGKDNDGQSDLLKKLLGLLEGMGDQQSQRAQPQYGQFPQQQPAFNPSQLQQNVSNISWSDPYNPANFNNNQYATSYNPLLRGML